MMEHTDCSGSFYCLLMTILRSGWHLNSPSESPCILKSWEETHKVKEVDRGQLVSEFQLTGECVRVTIFLSLSCFSSPCTFYCNGVRWISWCQLANTMGHLSTPEIKPVSPCPQLSVCSTGIGGEEDDVCHSSWSRGSQPHCLTHYQRWHLGKQCMAGLRGASKITCFFPK